MPRRRTFILLVLLLPATLFLLHKLSTNTPLLKLPTAHLVPANSTLGFGTILAVSHSRSPRCPGLLWAANLTDLEIVIPEQSEWTEGDVQAFRAKDGSSISRGSALAWMGHLNTLKWFLSTPHTTALIIEDDTDWDLSLRLTQTPLLSSSLHTLLNTSQPTSYWPPTDTWDLIYPGHCDDFLAPPTYLTNPHLLYPDNTTPQHTLLHPDTYNFLLSLHVPSTTRILHRAYWPFCTFAYAVTRQSAARILSNMAREAEGGTSAFDVALLEACRDRGWRCWSVSPELFHHGLGESEIQRADVNGTMGEGKVGTRGAWNIGCGARHGQLWVDEGDGEGRVVVKDMVRRMVEKGECPIDGVEEESTWSGCEWGECGGQS